MSAFTKENSKKRQLFGAVDERKKSRIAAPLEGVTVCLTGLSSERKLKIHNLVEKLGGKFTRDLITQKTTHLIAETQEGQKYEESKKYKHISIVRPEWIEMCAKTMSKVDISLYLLDSDDGKSKSKGDSYTTNLYQRCQELLMDNKLPPNPLFSGCSFLLVGFLPAIDYNNSDDDIMSAMTDVETSRLVRNEFSRLIRRCMGTIYWKPSVSITHIIVSDFTDGKTRTDISNFCRQHPNKPYQLSTDWILSCVTNKQLMDPNDAQFQPKERVLVLKKKKQTQSVKSTKAGIFNGLYFHINQSSLMPSGGAYPLSSDTAEKLITLHGGCLLAKSGIQSLKKDTSRKTSKMCIYIHFSGAYDESSFAKTDLLLTQINQNKLCDIIAVNPLWLQTCDICKQFIEPSKYRDVFDPQLWPVKTLPKETNLKIAVTGFVGPHRQALKLLILAIGAEYSESMSNRNTHLICLEKSGAKYLKALEWNIQVVDLSWLLDVSRRGYSCQT